MKRVFRILLPVLILVVGVLLTFVMIKARPEVKPEPKEPNTPLVRVAKVQPQEHRFTVTTQGTVTPRIEINLAAEVSGKIVAVAPSFATGGFFDTNDALVKIDPRDYELALARARAQLAEAEVRLLREQAESDVARKEWEALGSGDGSPLLRREPQLAEAQAAVDSAKAIVQQTQLDLQRCEIKAPFAGRVWSKRVDAGQFLARGETVARIYSVDAAEVRLPLTLDDLSFLELPLAYQNQTDGPEVKLRANMGGTSSEWAGRILRTEAEVDPRTRMIHAVAQVEQPYKTSATHTDPLAVGLFVQAEILGRAVSGVLVVPRASVRGRDRLMVVDSDNLLRFRPVEVLRLETERAILKDSLQPGDRICLSPLDAPVDGMKVRVTEVSDAAGVALGANLP
jgi:membrane fusion protein, multidrug efflux system